MNIIIIIILIVLQLYLYLGYFRNEHFIDREFFYEKVKTSTISCREWDRDIMDRIIIGPHIYSNSSNSSSSGNSSSSSDYVLDVSVPEGHLFLGTLISNPVIMLVPNTHRIFDFAGLSTVSCFRVGLSHGTELIWTALSTLLDPQVLSRITTTVISEDEAVSRYGSDIDALLVTTKVSPLKYLRTITDQVPSHLLYFNAINSGNYFILDNEKAFYHEHPQFQKQLLDLLALKKQYPALTTVKKEMYLPTFKVNYVLSCHSRLQDADVKKTLAQILRLKINRYIIKTIVDISNNKTSAPDHPVAIAVYSKIHSIYGDSPDSGVVL
jgi:hypothetical protein